MLDNFQDIRALLLRNGFVPTNMTGYVYGREFKGIVINVDLNILQASASFLDKQYKMQNPYSTKNCVITAKLDIDYIKTQYILDNFIKTAIERSGE